MNGASNIGNRIVRLCCGIVFALLTAVFLFLSVASLTGTCVIDPAKYALEHVLFQKDSIWINLIVLAVLLALIAQPAVGQEGGSGRRCGVLGDSLAVGAARHAPGCEMRARIGIGSADITRRTQPLAPSTTTSRLVA